MPKSRELFRLDWAAVSRKLALAPAGTPEHMEVADRLIQRARAVILEVKEHSERETQAWIVEFQTNLAQFEKDLKAQMEAARPGGIDVEVTDGNRADTPVEVSLDGMIADRFSDTAGSIGYVAPGLHRVTAKAEKRCCYYPWVRIIDPITDKEADMPPSGFAAGIYARNDINRAVYKAPANAVGFQRTLNKAQQDALNPEGINCFHFVEGRRFRVWGARTASSDPEWKYVNLRRHFIYLEHSIDKGTQWAVFEPNGAAVGERAPHGGRLPVQRVADGRALLGDKPEKASFAKCDRSTMTQNDLDNGRLVVQIGVAAIRPAQFVIFRIGQWTAERKVQGRHTWPSCEIVGTTSSTSWSISAPAIPTVPTRGSRR